MVCSRINIPYCLKPIILNTRFTVSRIFFFSYKEMVKWKGAKEVKPPFLKTFSTVTTYNGGDFYKVEAYQRTVTISEVVYNDDENEEEYKLLKTYKNVRGLFTGFDVNNNKGWNGSTVLIHISANRYVWVSGWLEEFSILKEPVVYFFSNMGNSGVPYETIVTHSRFLISGGWIPRSESKLPSSPAKWSKSDVEMFWVEVDKYKKRYPSKILHNLFY